MKSVSQKKSSLDAPSQRIVELQKKIRDRAYIDSAIQRIAFVMSKQLVEGIPVKKGL